MYALLAIAISLCPQRIDENIHSALRDRYFDKMNRLQRGDEICFKELFCVACPKFISPAPSFGHQDDSSHSGISPETQHQLNIFFLDEVRQQIFIPTLRSYLKLYTTINISKLAHFLELDQESLRTQLMCVKHKTRNLVGNGSTSVSNWNSPDVDFYVDQAMIHIANTKVTRRYSDYFIKHIVKFQEIISELESDRRHAVE